MGMDHSRSAAGTVGLSAPWPAAKGLASNISCGLPASAIARRTRTSLKGSSSTLMTPTTETSQMNSTVWRFGLRRRAFSRSTRRTTMPSSGAKSYLPASQAANFDAGSGSIVISTPSA